MPTYTTRARFPLRTWVAVLLLMTVALIPTAGILRRLASLTQLPSPYIDSISAFEKHLAPVSAALRDQPIVGYLSYTEPGTSDPAKIAQFYLAQYALVPVMVIRDRNQRLVLTTTALNPLRPASDLPTNLTILRDFGNGVVLFESEDR